MTIGIYALYWEEQDLIYIGQSVNIEKRFKDHLYKLRTKTHSNYKVLSTYEQYGTPTFNIVETCTLSKLDEAEIFWTNEFNSKDNGLNIIDAGHSLNGLQHARSTYSKLQILQVFRINTLHEYSCLTGAQIALLVGVNKSLVAGIRCGQSHKWLQEKYPYLYKRMGNIQRPSIGAAIAKEYCLLSPDNKLTQIGNLDKFSKENGLDPSAMYKVVKGIRKQHKGWRLP